MPSFLAEESIMVGCEEWEGLSESQQLDLAAAFICAKSQNWARFEYVSETRFAESLLLLIGRAMKAHNDAERFSHLNKNLVKVPSPRCLPVQGVQAGKQG